MTALLAPLLREASIERHNKGVRGFNDGSLVVTLTRQSETEIRALVRNGNAIEYGVTLTLSGAFCSCKDNLYRAGVCKHAVAVAVFCLQQQEALQNSYHLLWRDGTQLCDAPHTARIWVWPWTSHMLTWPECCKDCVQIYHSGYNQHVVQQTAAREAA